MIRDVLAIETGDLVFPIIFEVATSREYHAARELYGARFKHISLAISDIDTKFYLISTICRYISIIIRIPETSPHDVNPRHSRFSVLQLKFSKGRQKIWYILVINLQSYFGELCLPVRLRNIPVRPEIEHGLLSGFRALALILDQSIGVVGISTIKPVGSLGAPEKHG